MKNSSNYSARSIEITEDEYNYLLPAIPKILLKSGNQYFIIVDGSEELKNTMVRMTGLYDRYIDLPENFVRHCFKFKTLEPFRNNIKKL